jgi:RNA polymerase sigma factor (sigma-70 family)
MRGGEVTLLSGNGRYRPVASGRLLQLLLFTMTTTTSAVQRRNRRVETYRRLVRPIAHHYAQRSPEPLEDLEQVGLLGLLRAAELYNGKSHTPFDAFARPHVRGAILHYLRDRVQPIRLPRRVSEQLDLRRRCLSGMRSPGGNPITDEMLRTAMGLSHQSWADLEYARRLNVMVSLDSPEGCAGSGEMPAVSQEERLELSTDSPGSEGEPDDGAAKAGPGARSSPPTGERQPPGCAASLSICRSSVLMAASAAASWRSRASRQKRSIRIFRS